MKKVFEFLKELRKKPYGKSVFFFSFYFIFFVVIFLILFLGGNKDIEEEKETNGVIYRNPVIYNYSFNYKVTLDNNVYEYIGNKKSSIIEYKYNNNEYYNEGNKSYIKNEEWKEVENPIKVADYLSEQVINKILQSAYLESKTTYDNGDVAYNLLISSNTINSLVYGENTDIEETPNKIIVSLNKNKFINSISYNLDSYCKNSDICNNLNIIIEYNDYSSKS